jgi:hypothetical protein
MADWKKMTENDSKSHLDDMIPMWEGTAAAAAVSLENLLPRLAEFCALKSICKFLRKDATLETIEFQ